MIILYIGQYTPGTTSKMRADQLNEILNPQVFEIIDTHIPFFKTPKLFRSLGFRYKRGPLVVNTNQFIKNSLAAFPQDHFDIIWVDKAVYITKETTLLLRKMAKKLVHFTPDMAFYGNRTAHFIKSLPIYDFVISTKTKEIPIYQEQTAPEKIILTTQGFDSNIHKPLHAFAQKENTVAFIGLAEPSRFQLIENLIHSGIHVKLAGKGWNSFVKKNQSNKNLEFIGESLFNESYADFISSTRFSIGMLSKRFPEFHTTRTFEIPACGTALITERNTETSSFFNQEEAIFYDTPEEMIEHIKYYQNHPLELEALTNKGRERVIRDGRDYRSVLEGVLSLILNV